MIIYIQAQCAKEDLALRKLSGDYKLKELQMPAKKKRHTQRNRAAIERPEQKIVLREISLEGKNGLSL